MPQLMTNERALPARSLDGSRRTETIDGLNNALASLIDLGLSAKQAHWNVRGPNFQGLHELFDVVANEARAWADLVAERAVSIGGVARGTVQDTVAASNLAPFPPEEQRWDRLTEEMRDRTLAVAERLRGFATSLDDELVTQDLYIEIIRGLEMRAWMLDAHLGGA